MSSGCIDAGGMLGCRAVVGMQLLQLQGWSDCRGGVAAGMQGGYRDAEQLQGCRVVTGIGVAAGLQNSCRDAG